jgi:Domain of unknown function (DUF4333)
MRRIRSATAVLVVALPILLATGCRPTLLDSEGLESQLQTQLAQELGTGVLSVSCPDDVEVAAKSSFECTASGGDGADLTVTVTQTNDEGDVTWKVTDAS